jgi:hypothetical protein
VHVDKAAAVEEVVNRESNLGAYAEDRREQVGARAKVRLLTKILNGMALGLQGIIGR